MPNEHVEIIADGLSRLSQEELDILDQVITPQTAALFIKAFGPEMKEILEPLYENDPPESSPQTDMREQEASLRQLMRDPRYWRDKDPAVMDAVVSGFKKLYPTKN